MIIGRKKDGTPVTLQEFMEEFERVKAEHAIRKLRDPAEIKRMNDRVGKHIHDQLNGYRKMSADELYDALKTVADTHDLPVEIDGSEGIIPVMFNHLAWSLYFFPKTMPVRVERRGELPDRSDELWTPLWTFLDTLGTPREAVRPLSRRGYQLFAMPSSDPGAADALWPRGGLR